MLFIIRVLACSIAVFLSGHSIAFEQRDYVLYEGLYNDDSKLDYILFPHQAVALSGSINVTLLKETGATPYVLNTLDGSDERYSLITADQSKLNTLLREKKLTPSTNHHLIYGDLDEDGKSDIVLQPKSDFGNLIVIRDVSESPILSVFSMADLSHHLIGSNSVTLTIADGKLVLTSKAYGEIRLRLDFTETPSSDNSTTPSLIGAIPYDAWVDVSGAARYQVPIRLPSGINHLQPNLSLDYNSNRGNGVAGVGWSLSGTPVISRCSANIAEDGYNSGIQFNEKDRYCLNGQKLISVSGTYGVDGAYYTLEKDNSFKIISHGGEDYNPRYWQVTDSQGKVWYYGQKPGARLNDGDRRISWYLDRVVGITGNVIDYTYDNTNESGDLVIRLAKINYAGTEVTFSYQARNDVNTYYLAGAKRIEDKLLTEIKITNSADNAWNNRYLLNYDKSTSTDRSQLTSIMLCGQECLSPTVFNYEGKESTNFQAISSTSLGNFKDFQFIPMNINGDGFQDFVQIRKSDSFYEFIVFMNARNGSYYQSQIERFNDSENSLPSRRFYAIDVNRDGLDDLIDIEHRQGQDKYITWVSDGQGRLVSDKQKRLFGSKDDGTLPASIYRIIDLNGDGYQDMFDIYRDENTAVARVTFGIEGGIGDQTVTTQLGIWNKFANPNTSNIQFVDTNGDGVLDIFAPYRLTPNSPISSVFQVSKSISESRYTIVINKGDGRFEQAIESEYMYGWNDEIDKQPSFLTMDFNGDGLKDVVKVREDNGNTKLGAWVNTGNDEFIVGYRETTLLDGWQSPINPTRPKYFALDINQDGAEDLIYTHVVNDHTVLEGWVSLKNGKFSRYSQTTINDRGDETVFFMADTNGDSINDVIEIYNNAGTAKVDSWSTSISPYQDKLKSAETGLALSTTFDYGLTSNTLFYRASEFPKGTVQTQSRARPIVFGMGYDTGLGDVSQQYYRYYDLKTHTQGIGNLGFTKIEKFDLGQNIAEVTQFNQDWKARRYASVKKKEVCALTDTFNFSNYSGTNYCVTDSTNLLERESHFWVSDIYAPDKSSRGRCTDNNCSSAEPSKVTFHVNKHQSLYEKWGANNDFISKQLVKRTYNDTGQLTRTVTQHGTGVSEYDLNGGFGLFDIQVTEQDDYTYDTNLAAKHIYKPTSVSRSVVGSNLADTSNTTHFQYDANGVLTTKVIEPGTDKQIIETFSNFDRGLPGLITRSWLSSDSASTSLPTNSTSEQYHYDVNGSVSLMRDALDYTQTFTEHPLYGVQSSYTDINGQTTTTEVDVLGRVIKAVAPQSTTYYEYKDCNGCTNNARYYVYKTTIAQPAEKVYYDTLGREVKSEKQILNGTWSQVTTEYNTKGQVTKVSVPSLGKPSLFTVYEYDNTGRMTLENRPASDHSIAYRYDGLLHTKDEIFSGGTQTSKNMMNVFGLLDYGLDAMGNKTQYFYNGRKQLVKTIDVDRNAIDIEYDIHGYRTKLVDPDKGTWTYTNNAFGLVASETNGNGQVTGFNYDLLGRMTSSTNSEGTSSWQYDSDTSGVGQLSKATQVSSSGKGTYVEDYSYDGFGNLEKKVVNYGDGQTAEMNWHYVQGKLNTQTFPGGYAIKQVYNSTGYLSQIQNATDSNDVHWQANSMDARGNLTGYKLDGTLTTTRSYDAATGFVQTINSGWNGESDAQLSSYTFDSLGNLKKRENKLFMDSITTQANQKTGQSFTYDALNRLATWNTRQFENNQDAIQTLEMEYEKNGNIFRKPDVGRYYYGANQGTNNCTVTPGPHAVSYIEGKGNYCYDQSGNMLSGDGKTLTYTSFDKPKTISKASENTTTEILYGPSLGRYKRIDTIAGETQTTWYLDGLYEKVLDKNSKTTERFYLGDFGLMERTTASNGIVMDQTRYFLKDHIGSVLAIAEGNSMRLLQEFHYDVWGKREYTKVYDDSSLPAWDSFGLTGRLGFTGHEMLDNVGLIHMNGRVYDPELGRFVSADPKVPDPFNSQAFNRYTYVYNNPLSFTDPDGFSPKSGDDSSSSDFGFGWGDLASFAVGFTPAGIAADVYGAVTGEDLFTGEKLTPWERATNVIPGASEARKIGKAAKAVQEAAEKLAKKEADAKKAPGPKGKGSGKDQKDPKDTNSAKDIKNARQRGVNRAKSAERDLVKSGHPGTADNGGWSFAERKRIAETGQFPSDTRWHHINDVKRNPSQADVADNVIPSRGGNAGHVRKHHPNGTQAGSSGPLLNRSELKNNHMNGN